MVHFAMAIITILGTMIQNVTGTVPRPTPRQIEYMNDVEIVQFMHFSLPTYWKPGREFLSGPNPTYHNCDREDNTTKYRPCMDPTWFQPSALDTDEWMEASVALGVDEICLTARHEGGFTMWPSRYTPYGVHASPWRDGKGDVLKEFVSSAKKYGIKICYYFGVASDGYSLLSDVGPKVNGSEFIRLVKGEIMELLTEYGPVNRFWFDHGHLFPADVTENDIKNAAFELIRKVSPSTLLSPYSGDIMNNPSGTVYTANGAAPNSTSTPFEPASETGEHFYPLEQHGITIQMGPDGATTGVIPTFWFWHDWACVNNVTGCPWVGQVSPQAIFDSYVNITGQGNSILINIPPNTTGQYNATVVEHMKLAGRGIKATFQHAVRQSGPVSGDCKVGMVQLTINDPTLEFDYIVTQEDLTSGQRIANYSVEYQTVGSDEWQVLVPVINSEKKETFLRSVAPKEIVLGDEPSGQTARDSHIGRKRIDVPVLPDGSLHRPGKKTSMENVGMVRFNCHAALEEPVYIKNFALHKYSVPWEDKHTEVKELDAFYNYHL